LPLENPTHGRVDQKGNLASKGGLLGFGHLSAVANKNKDYCCS